MAFDEDQHPRDEKGKFIETGGQKLKTWGSEGPRVRDTADERVSKVGDFMREAKKTLAANPWGFTIRPGYSAPKSGTVVALPTSAGLTLKFKPGEPVKREAVRDWVKKARNYLRAHDGTYIGGWKNDKGETYLEVSEVYKDHDQALKLGAKRNQEGVYRLDDGQYFPTGGTGD